MAIRTGSLNIKTLDELSIADRSVLCRVDLNVPIKDGKVTDDTRITSTLPTLKYLLKQNCKVVLCSHLGRPKGKPDPKYSLVPVGERLAHILGQDVTVPDDCVGDGVRRVLQEQRSGTVVLLENLRFHAEEEANSKDFAEALANGLDVYVTDAFGSLHRAHASTHAAPRLFRERAAGFLVEKELRALTPLLEAPEHPYAVILGGAKVSDKVKVIENLLKKVDRILFGGAMVFTFLRAMGQKTGNSLVETDKLVLAERILAEAKSRGVRMLFPKDFRIGQSLENPGEGKISTGCDIPEGWMGLDIGPDTVRSYVEALQDAKTIFWNGPLGLFETPPFDQGTVGIAKVLGELKSTRVIGGGDSAAAVSEAGVADRMTHISTGGGATLEFLEGKTLPGLEALGV